MFHQNEITLIGRTGQDAEFKVTENQESMAILSVATTETWKDKTTGEPQERTEWHRIVVFGKLADFARDHVTKGRLVWVRGPVRYRKYEKEGQDHYVTEIRADKVQFLDSKPDNG